MANKKAIGCMPVDMFKTIFGNVEPADGTLKDQCQRCGCSVYVSTSSWGIIHDNPGIEIVCIPCLSVEIEKADTITVHGLTPAQVEDIAHTDFKEAPDGGETA